MVNFCEMDIRGSCFPRNPRWIFPGGFSVRRHLVEFTYGKERSPRYFNISKILYHNILLLGKKTSLSSILNFRNLKLLDCCCNGEGVAIRPPPMFCKPFNALDSSLAVIKADRDIPLETLLRTMTVPPKSG